MTRDFSETFREAREFNKDLAARQLNDLQMEYVFFLLNATFLVEIALVFHIPFEWVFGFPSTS